VAQRLWGQTGQGEKTVGARLIGQHPPQRLERDGLGRAFGCGLRARRVSVACDLPVSVEVPKLRGQDERRASGEAVPKRILVVEDNDLNRKLFCDVLRANGFEVVPVADGQNVLPTARKCKPDAVVLDIQLPNVSGIELIAGFHADRALRAVPILAVTAYAGKGDEEKIRAAGARAYLAKPVSITPFMAAVRALIEPEDALVEAAE
jgi:two-component system, cell cycle response regulator DivK